MNIYLMYIIAYVVFTAQRGVTGEYADFLRITIGGPLRK